MNIQASVNQGISLATLLATQSPGLKAMGEKASKLNELSKKEQAITEARDIASGKNKEGTLSPKEAEAYQEELQSIKKQQFELDPTAESYQAYKEAAPYGEERVLMEEEPFEIAKGLYQEQEREKEVEDWLKYFNRADTSVATKQQQISETRRRILEGTPSEYILRGEK